MATFHLSPKTISREAGRCVVAAAAYRSGECLTDTRTGLTHDYTRRAGVLHSEIVAPAGAPPWAYDRGELWNAVEAKEDQSTRRAVARTGREFEVSLPHELTHDQRVAAGMELVKYLVDTYGFVADVAFHAPHAGRDERNFHMHVLTTTRVMTDAGLGGKIRELDMATTSGAHITEIRRQWADIANRHLAAAGHDTRIDHRSFEEQGLDKTATVHLGPSAAAMERRGEPSDRGDLNRAAAAENAARAMLKAEAAAIDGKIIDLEAERQRRADERADRAAVRTHDPAAILEAITARRSTFSERELAWTVQKTVADPYQRKELVEAIIARPEIIGLAEAEGGKATRYTTAAVLDHERRGMDAAAALAADRGHAVSRDTLLRVMEKAEFGTMSEEQRAAFLRATGPGGLAIIAGEAGTGKSYTANAIRQAYEAEGGRVIGLAFTNKVMQDMKREGFNEAGTITGALQDLAKGRAGWNSRTVLMVDEAAMLATKDMVPLVTKAQEAGAKVILVQDQQQLASAYNRGGLAGAIETAHPEAVSRLTEVIRVKDAEQQAAFNAMQRGDFRAAVQIFDQLGRIQWGETREDARAALVTQWAKSSAERPDAVRFVYTHTNAEAKEINAALRAVRRERGELGPDHVLPTKDGPLAFATGDRVQFTGSAYDRAIRDAGLANGMVGTVQRIDGQSMTVALDGKKDAAPRVVSFTVGENARAGEFNAIQYGHAGTVYRGQGSTVDEAYYPHSPTARASTNYVATTRHRQDVHIFAARDATPTLEHLARQMGRYEENRAASQFHRAGLDPARRFDSAAQETAQRATRSPGSSAPPEASSASTARAAAEAQRKAAIIGRVSDPQKVAAALYRAHKKDATSRAEAGGSTRSSGGDWRAQLDAKVKAAKVAQEQEDARRPRQGLGIVRTRGRTR